MQAVFVADENWGDTLKPARNKIRNLSVPGNMPEISRSWKVGIDGLLDVWSKVRRLQHLSQKKQPKLLRYTVPKYEENFDQISIYKLSLCFGTE